METRKLKYFGRQEHGDYGQAVKDDNNGNLTFVRMVFVLLHTKFGFVTELVTMNSLLFNLILNSKP